MTKLFLDTNIVVDLLERREPFYNDAVRLFTMAYNRQVTCRFANDIFHSFLPPAQARF